MESWTALMFSEQLQSGCAAAILFDARTKPAAAGLLELLISLFTYKKVDPSPIMSKKRKSKYKAYVPHPRYGDKPVYSGESFTLEEIHSAFWRYRGEAVFPESAVAADVDKQNYSIFPRKVYVDIEKACRECGRHFLFYALEQRYWFEELGSSDPLEYGSA
ncbi:MAG: hypothetical protein DHS20C11_01100 [Lysobacteraceae bacterium]|nr:MAG: hypothetical protein DHS20C11_01100 [Xanthomonadaceae bacterium]